MSHGMLQTDFGAYREMPRNIIVVFKCWQKTAKDALKNDSDTLGRLAGRIYTP